MFKRTTNQMEELQRQPQSFIPTGSIGLDLAMGNGGIPAGSLVEISGPMCSGKTALCLSIIAQANKLGKQCTLIDSDMSITRKRLETYGVNPEITYISQVTDTKQTLNIIDHLIHSGSIDVVVLDSINALTNNVDTSLYSIQKTSSHPNHQISRALSKIKLKLKRSGAILILTNHSELTQHTIYHKLAENMSRLSVKLHASISMQLELNTGTQEDQDIHGWQVLVKLKKNQVSPCMRQVKLDIMYNDGILKERELINLGLSYGILKKSAEVISYQGQIFGKTIEECLGYLRSTPEVCQEIENLIRFRAISSASPDETKV